MNKKTRIGLLLAAVLFVFIGVMVFAPNSTTMSSYNANDTLQTRGVIDTLNTRVMQWKHYFEVRRISAERRSFYQTQVRQMFIEAGFSPGEVEVFSEIPTVESNWDALAVSSAGARGLWQIMPGLAKQYGVPVEKLFDPYISTRIAINHLKDLHNLHKGDVAKILFSYNGGTGVVNGYLETYKTDNVWLIPFAARETYDYAPKVLGATLALNGK